MAKRPEPELARSPFPLATLFSGGRSADCPVALVGAQTRTWCQFQQDAARVAALARRSGGLRWILACEEAWDFATGFFGLLLAGRTLVLPPNLLPETLERLQASADGLIQGLPPAQASPCGLGVDPGPLRGTVEFWTSGTTGDPKAVPKDLAQLDAEVSMLEAAFGERLGSGPMVGTVPHYHIYGCLFRILWPLATGRPFLCEPCGEPAGFRQAMAQAPALISSPAHLSRLPSLMELSELPAFPCVVFSSGGPLDRKDALAWRRWVPAGVVEIYGSTESGGIAWRCQDEDAESSLWTPLADVALTLAPDGALVVASFRAGPGPLRMEDLAEPASGGRFRLLGRLDRTIKLEEKRVSLPELEAALEAHPLVERAAVVLLEGRRPTLGAVVVLRGAQAQERRQLIRTLRLHLAQRFEPVALPRRWRFLDHLPFDLKGKLTAQTLAALFQREEGQS